MKGNIQVADIDEAQNLLERAVNLTLGDDPVQEFLQKCWRDLEHEKEEQGK